MTAIIMPTKPLRKSPRAFRKAKRRLSHKENGSKAQGKQSSRKAKLKESKAKAESTKDSFENRKHKKGCPRQNIKPPY
jgi:hypothetical protein